MIVGGVIFQQDSKLTCHELEGLGDLRLIGVGFRNSTHFDEGVLEELRESVCLW